MRTIIKSKEHFDDYIGRQPLRIVKFDEAIENGTVKVDGVLKIRRKQFAINLHTLIAKYSRGDEVTAIKSGFTELLERMEEGWTDDKSIPNDKYQFDHYYHMITLLSMGVLLEIEASDFARIVKILDDSGRKDELLEYIIGHVIRDRDEVSGLMYANPFQVLLDVTKEENKESQTRSLISYLHNAWYKGMRNAYWHENHTSRHDTFFGYWSFDSAAVAKILNLEIASFENLNYFPVDMLKSI